MSAGQLHALLGAYVLGALDGTERRRFEAHLERCALCQSELAAYRAAADRLGDAEPRAGSS